MQARQGNHVPYNVYLEDKEWDKDLLLFQAHTVGSAEFVVNAINFYIEAHLLTADSSTDIIRMLSYIPAVEKRTKADND